MSHDPRFHLTSRTRAFVAAHLDDEVTAPECVCNDLDPQSRSGTPGKLSVNTSRLKTLNPLSASDK